MPFTPEAHNQRKARLAPGRLATRAEHPGNANQPRARTGPLGRSDTSLPEEPTASLLHHKDLPSLFLRTGDPCTTTCYVQSAMWTATAWPLRHPLKEGWATPSGGGRGSCHFVPTVQTYQAVATQWLPPAWPATPMGGERRRALWWAQEDFLSRSKAKRLSWKRSNCSGHTPRAVLPATGRRQWRRKPHNLFL